MDEAVELYKQLLAEGGSYEQSSNFKQAIICYTSAIEAISEGGQIQEEDLGKHVLCLRSRCMLRVGKTPEALTDAEKVLKMDPKYLKGLYAKAEALYFKGDFEFALVFYHRGHFLCEKSAGPAKQFTLGIQKAQEAIDNAIGSVEHCRLTTKGDLTGYYEAIASDAPPKPGAKTGASRRRQGTAGGGRRTKKTAAKSDKTVASLLGELYADKAYLEDLMKDTTLGSDLGEQVKKLATDGASYLSKRSDFWRQQKPIYARVNAAKVTAFKNTMKGSAGRAIREQQRPSRVIAALERVEHAMDGGDPDRALSIAQKAMKSALEIKGPERDHLVGNLHSAIGSAQMDIGALADALDSHNKDLMLAQKKGSSEAESRALGNIGRVYANQGLFDKALEAWLKKVPLVSDALESSWLFHEIGRCHYAKAEYLPAKEMGEKSKTHAIEADDAGWQLNSLILVGQAQAELGDLNEAVESFEAAKKLAKITSDGGAVTKLNRSISETKERMVDREPPAV